MNPSLAVLAYAIGITGLFFLDRDKSARTSAALWLPVLWVLIVGSRPASVWLGFSSGTVTASQLLEGSPFDLLIFAALQAIAMIVLIRRAGRTSVFLRANWPLLIYFSYCLFSIIWSDFPDVAIKRWIKALGDLVMVLIVVTDAQPIAALKRFFSRTGFILLPSSVLVIKYFPYLGRGYDSFTGIPINVGVTNDKNLLGLTTFILSLGAVWRILKLLWNRDEPNWGRHLLAQSTLLAFGIALLMMAHSATSGACFILGAGLLLATNLPIFRNHRSAVHALMFSLVLAGVFIAMVGGRTGMAQAMGRSSDLTGRTAIWDAAIDLAPNAVFGAGFESFWLGPRLDKMWLLFPLFHPNEAHNGYIEVYLNLGWVGLVLIALILVDGYRRACATIQLHPAVGGLSLGFVATAAIYSVTEGGFRMLNPIWIFFLLALVSAGGIAQEPLREPTSQYRHGLATSTAGRS